MLLYALLVPDTKLFFSMRRLSSELPIPSLAWAVMYIVVARLVERFDMEPQGAGPKDVECVSDQFIIGTADPSGIKAVVARYEG